MFKKGLTLAWIGGFALLAACADTGEDAVESEPMEQHLLASVALSDGGSIEFHEPMPGELVAIYVGKDPTLGQKFDDLERGDLTHAQLFESLAGRKAPAALVEAEGREIAALARIQAHRPAGAGEADLFDAPPAVAGPATVNGIGSTRASMTAADFIAGYCPSGWGYLFCWTSRTGSGSVTKTSISMYTYLNAYNGSVLHELLYQNVFGNWVTYVSNVVPQGFLSYASRSGIWTTRKTSISQATGDGYHVSIYGTN